MRSLRDVDTCLPRRVESRSRHLSLISDVSFLGLMCCSFSSICELCRDNFIFVCPGELSRDVDTCLMLVIFSSESSPGWNYYFFCLLFLKTSLFTSWIVLNCWLLISSFLLDLREVLLESILLLIIWTLFFSIRFWLSFEFFLDLDAFIWFLCGELSFFTLREGWDWMVWSASFLRFDTLFSIFSNIAFLSFSFDILGSLFWGNGFIGDFDCWVKLIWKLGLLLVPLLRVSSLIVSVYSWSFLSFAKDWSNSSFLIWTGIYLIWFWTHSSIRECARSISERILSIGMPTLGFLSNIGSF